MSINEWPIYAQVLLGLVIGGTYGWVNGWLGGGGNLVERLKGRRRQQRLYVGTWLILDVIYLVLFLTEGHWYALLGVGGASLMAAYNWRLIRKTSGFLNSPYLYLSALREEFGTEGSES